MSEELVIYSGAHALVSQSRGNYTITDPLSQGKADLKRDIDFGVIPGTKRPSLFKAGAEKVISAYGLLQHYEIETKIEDYGKDPFFMYVVKCRLVKVANNGQEYVFSEGIGSANTKEKRNGFNDAFNAANSNLKMAQKRAMVAAAINLGSLSDLFYQDIEDEKFVNEGYKDLSATLHDDDPITSKQMKRIYAIGADAGYNANEVKTKISAQGFASVKDIKQKDYDRLCDMFARKEEK